VRHSFLRLQKYVRPYPGAIKIGEWNDFADQVD